jgi:hypothetical protein
MSDSLERKRQNAIGEEYDLSMAVPVYCTAGRIEPNETLKYISVNLTYGLKH